MSNKPSYVLQAFVETPWAILPSKLAVLEEIIVRHVSGEKLNADEVQARIHGAARPPERRMNSVAVLPLFGTIFPRANMMTDVSGATSAERMGAKFTELLNDPAIDAIVLDVDSPGGQINGVDELSKLIFDARGKKPTVAVANHFMASAAYWIASAADEIVVTPSGEVGSIGVFAVHKDMSAALEQAGVKVSLISEGKFKVDGNPYEPLSEEARAAIQARVREGYDAFIDSVARNRGVDPASVRNGFGEGRMVGAYQAVNLGMADRIGTLDETVSRLFNTNVSPALFHARVSETQEAAQEPASDHATLQEARARLALVGNRNLEGENNMYLRELLNKRAAFLARATALVEAADQEGRDFTDDERKAFNEIMGEGESAGEISALDAKIEQVQAERARLKAAAEKKFSASEPEKPEPGNTAKTMKRADYDALHPTQQAVFIKSGGKVED